jgi:cytochrome c-type biogenesis protein CcmE
VEVEILVLEVRELRMEDLVVVVLDVKRRQEERVQVGGLVVVGQIRRSPAMAQVHISDLEVEVRGR